jgi:CRP-like cAMP-binding protein
LWVTAATAALTGTQNPAMADINMFKNSPDARDIAAGEVLFAQGDAGDLMYAVVEGEITLSRGDHVVDEIHGGEIVGEMALIDPDVVRSATATARTPARVVPIDRRQFTFLVHEHPTFALQVMKVMADRLRRANSRADTTVI